MVGAIGFEPSPTQPFQTLAGLGWQPKDRNGSQRNICWTRIGHCQFERLVANLPPRSAKPIAFEVDAGKVLQNPQPPRNKINQSEDRDA